MAPNMILTVEPGIYFNQIYLNAYLLNNPTSSQYVNLNNLYQYYPVGGVRIEDVVMVTQTGYVYLSNAARQIPQIEKLMD